MEKIGGFGATVTFSKTMQEYLYDAYVHDKDVYRCVSVLQRQVLQGGITIEEKGRRVTDGFESDVVKRLFVPFAKDAIREFIVYGVVTWTLVRDPITKHLYPRVFPMYRAQLHYNENLDEYTAYDEWMRPTVGVHVYETPDFRTQRVVSELSRVLQVTVFERALVNNAQLSDSKNARAPVAIESVLPSAQTMTAVQTHNVALRRLGAPSSSDSAEDTDFMQEILTDYARIYNTARGGGSGNGSSIPSHTLTPGKQIRNISFPTTRGDLVHLIQYLGTCKHAGLGVPTDLVQSAGISRQGGLSRRARSSESMEMLEHSAGPIRDAVTCLLTLVYVQCVHPNVDPAVDGKSLCMADVKITIPPVTSTDDRIIDYFKLGLIPQDVMRDRLAAKYGFDRDAYSKDERGVDDNVAGGRERHGDGVRDEEKVDGESHEGVL